MKCNRTMSNDLAFDYYDRLVTSDDTVLLPLVGERNDDHVGRNVYLIQNSAGVNNEEQQPANGDTSENADLLLCHIPIMFRWSQQQQQVWKDVSTDAYGGSSAALLALHHYHTGNGRIVQEFQTAALKECPVRFTTEFLDSESSGQVGVKRLLSTLSRRPQSGDGDDDGGDDGANPLQPCAFLGSSWSSVTRKLATVSGVYDLPLVTSSASSVTLDDASEYPLFARTHPSDLSMAYLTMEYLVEELQITHIANFYIDNAWGASYHNALLERAAQYGTVTVASASYLPGATDAEIQLALTQLQGYHYIIGVFYGADYERILEQAGPLGLADGMKHVWVSGICFVRVDVLR